MNEQQLKDSLREIRNSLRLAMNGMVATSMREKGMNYRLIFGVPIPELRRIAAEKEPDAVLAEAMWQEDVRELKILATMLYPTNACTVEFAERWIREIPYPEIAEQLVRNLLSKMADADALALRLLADAGEEMPFARMVAFLLFLYRSDARKPEEDPVGAFTLRNEALRLLLDEVSTDWNGRQAARLALKHYGRRSKALADGVLADLADLKESGRPEQRALYDDIRFEYEYYGE